MTSLEDRITTLWGEITAATHRLLVLIAELDDSKRWANGGETRLPNLVTLCHFHHHLVHEGGYGLERTDTGEFVFTHPEGYRLDDCAVDETCFRGNIAALNRDHGIRIEPGTIDTRWTGERMDYSLAIGALIAARERSQTLSTTNNPEILP